MIKKFLLLLVMSFPFLSPTFAGTDTERMIIAPTCLLNKIHSSYSTLAEQNNLKLIKINKKDISALTKASHHPSPCGRFMELTVDWQTMTTSRKTLQHPPHFFLKH